jgi:hypothetical protein
VARCRGLTRQGKPCMAMALHDANYCFFHSDGIEGRPGRPDPKPITKEHMIQLLEKEVRCIKRFVKNPLERSKELRALLLQIDQVRSPGELGKEQTWTRPKL